MKKTKHKIESAEKSTLEGHSCFSIRCFDLCAALLMLLLTSPLILFGFVRSLTDRNTRNTTIETLYIEAAQIQELDFNTTNVALIGLKQFSYSGWCTKLPMLINLLKGDITILGTQSVFAFTAPSELNKVDTDNTEPKNAARSKPSATSKNKGTANNSSVKPSNTRFYIKPGLTSFEQMNAATGLCFECASTSLNKAHQNLAHYLLALFRALIIATLTRAVFNKPTSHDTKITVFGIHLNNWTMSQLLNEVLQQCKAPSKPMQQFSFVNTDCLNRSTQNEAYRQCLQQSDLIFADGIGVRLACLSKAKALKDNLNGTDMFPRLCELASNNHLSIFMLGGRAGIAEQAAHNMQAQYKNLKIAGYHHGYFDCDSNSPQSLGIVETINQTKADILLVAMGAPQQELWLAANRAKLNCAVGIGVGGLFDFYANRIKRAPLWLRQIGFEWSYRLLQEPKRMWKRYILGNPSFLYRVWHENNQLKKLRIHKESVDAKTATPLTRSQLKTKLHNATRKNQAMPQFDLKQANTRRAIFNMHQRINCACKRSLDVFISSSLLILLSPFLLFTIVLIRLESRGGALYSQTRAGRNNSPFIMWKFRSMYQDAEQRQASLTTANEMNGGVIFKMKKDPRITKVGYFIRKASIDELPQLWNVLKGDMSLVGPRPPLMTEVKQYSQHHRNRLMIKPGITCIWQVSGRSTIAFEQQVELDIDYIYQQSFTADLLILIKTIPAVIFARGAY
ncbi:WecB/TagA/CpsF family glycosyltransferase [Shewanella sp. 125m-1]